MVDSPIISTETGTLINLELENQYVEFTLPTIAGITYGIHFQLAEDISFSENVINYYSWSNPLKWEIFDNGWKPLPAAITSVNSGDLVRLNISGADRTITRGRRHCRARGVSLGDVDEIQYLQDLYSAIEGLNGTFYLSRDLDFNDDSSYDQTDPDWEAKKNAWTTGTGWAPLGWYGNIFSGTIYGNKHSISNLMINSPGGWNIGLFAFFNGSINDLRFLNVNVIGYVYVGGIAGNGYGSINRCFVSGTVTGLGTVGAFCGAVYSPFVMSNCHSSATVASEAFCGGLLGQFVSGEMINSYSIGVISGGGLTGTKSDFFTGSAINSYWDINASGTSSSGVGEGKTTAEMTVVPNPSGIYVDWDFETVWTQIDGGYPTLR